MSDDILSQLQHASDSAKKLFADLLNGGEATEEIIVSTIHDGINHLNNALGLNLEVPGLSKPARSAARGVSIGTGQTAYQWMSRNRGKTALIVAVIVAGVVSAGVAYSRAQSRRTSRKARRTKHGARKEVVLMIGNPGYSAMMRSVALDLEVRGFIVYVVVSTHEDMLAVQKETRSDIKTLYLATDDLQSSHTQQVIQQFHEILDSKHQAFANGPFHRLELCGILVAPEVSGTLKSVDRIPIASWSDYLSAKLTGTITTVTSFLPLAIEHQARIIVLTPSIIHSLSPPLHSMEATTVGALESYTHSLRRELSPAGVSVSHIQLGSIDFGALLRGSEYQRTRENKSSQPSVLHEAVFDALTMEGPFGSRRVGRGATVYGLIGSFAPTSLVDWMVRPKRGSTGPYKLISAE